MMKHFKLVLLAILLILGCMIALGDANNELQLSGVEAMQRDHSKRSLGSSRPKRSGKCSPGNNDENDEEDNEESGTTGNNNGGGNVGGARPCIPPKGSSPTSSRPGSSSASSASSTSSRPGTSSTSSRPGSSSSSTTGRPASTSSRPSSSSTTGRPGTSSTSSRPSSSSTTARPVTSSTSSRPSSSSTTASSATTARPATSSTASTSTTGRPSSTTSSSGGSNVGLCDLVPVAQEPLKLLVPLYVYPGSTWDQVAAGASKVPTIAIINPNSGPSSGPDSSYTSYMNKLNNAGVEMIGYVYTSYAARSIADVKRDIDTYASKFSNVAGIFFDEVSANSKDIAYYSQAYDYVKQKGMRHSILNPGTQPAAGYVDISTSIVIFEESGSKLASQNYPSFVTCAPNASAKSGYKYKFAGIAHSSASSSASSVLTNMKNKGMGLVYVTDGASGCCTYNNLVSYYSNQVSIVQGLNN